MRTLFRNVRVAELDCSVHFQDPKNREMFLSESSLACFRHVSESEVIFFLGDDISEFKFEQSKDALRGLIDKGASPMLVQDLLSVFEDGYAYVLMYAD